MEYNPIVMLVVSLVLSAFFSGIEIAFISCDKLQIELLANKGSGRGTILSRFVKNPSSFIGMTLIGNTAALVLYGYFMAELLDPIIAANLPEVLNYSAFRLFLQTVLSTLVVLLTAEFLPKSIFLINPNWLLEFFAFPLKVVYFIMSPLVFAVVGLSRFIIVSIFRLEYYEDKPAYSLTDLNNYINNTVSNEAEESSVELDTKIFNNALEFKTVRVRECMIPRTEIVAVDSSDSVDDLRKAFIKSGFSKIIVYKDSIDEVIGYCHSLEMFKKPKKISKILTPIIIVPETMLANELMIQFITVRKSIALVVDEFGGTSGIVTIEDIIEEIFGEIQDEHDDEDLTEQSLDSGTFLLSARHEIDYLNDKYDWGLPTGDYETLGGLILSVTEDIPKMGDTVVVEKFTFTIQSTEDIRIDTVKLNLYPEHLKD